LAALLLLPALLINLGLVPLYAEEPRRAVVAMEMLFRGNWIVPTIHGDFYHLKPPFFNWIIGSLYVLTDNYSEFVTRMPTVLSFLLLGLVIFATGRKYVGTGFGVLTSLLFLVAGGNLFFNSLLAEIDIFYSLVTYTSLICLFHFHRQKNYYLLFLSVYFLGAVGVVTKGAPSLVYTGLSILVYFIFIREFRKLFSPAHFLGIGLFLLIVGSYFLLYQSQGDTLFYFQNLSNESGKRFSGYSIWDYLVQIAVFPIDTIRELLPGALLLIFAIRKSFLRIAKENPLVKFALLMFVLHFPIYWLPPGSRQRYIIMLYPFLIQVIVYFFLKFREQEPRKTIWLNRILIAMTGLLALSAFVPLFVDKLQFIDGLPWICGIGFIAMAAIFIFQLRSPGSSLAATILLMVVLRIAFDLVVLPVRTREGKAYSNRKIAMELHRIIGNRPVQVYGDTYFPMQCTYYLERERKELLPRTPEAVPGEVHIVQNILLEDYDVRRDLGKLSANPLKPFSDPYSGDDRYVFSGYDYQTVHEFYLQKQKYLLAIPVKGG
jgi:4-amino-4-deoxy-L-arabinose transferase-like glycosyltransferase